MKSLSLAVSGMVLIASVALAQVDMKTPNTGVSATDTTFMKHLAQGGMAEVDAGRLAGDKASDPAVKQFGEQMVKDHTQNNDQLKALAQETGVTLPTTVGHENAAEKTKLQAESGSAFDAAYVKGQVQDHQKTVQLLEHEIHHGQDPQVKKFAEDTLTVVNHHLSMAKQLERTLPKSVAERGAQ